MSDTPSVLPLTVRYRAEPHSRVRQPTPLWLWGNILSLDAPIVAVLWHLLACESLGVSSGVWAPVALGLSVWVIYLSDHVLDARRPKPVHEEPARKVFFRNHPHLTRTLAAGGLLFTVWFAWSFLNPSIFQAGLDGGLLVALYFGSVHLLPARLRLVWPREAAVALLFSCGVCLPVWLEASAKRSQLLALALPLFLLCWLNCCAVETWDWRSSGRNRKTQPNTSALWIAGHIPLFALLTALFSVGLWMRNLLPVPVLAAAGLSGILVTATAQIEGRRSTALLSFLTDLALCTPLPILLLIWLHFE